MLKKTSSNGKHSQKVNVCQRACKLDQGPMVEGFFTDESRFELFGTKRRVYIRRYPGERFRKECVVPTMKHGCGSLAVWGGI